jgi:AcrR family transcriptional regulator
MARAEVGAAERETEASGPATRRRIVEAATTLFLARGYDAVPMSRVARAAGVTTPALYWHFRSKADLYFEVIQGGYKAFFAELIARTEGHDASQRLRSYVRTFVEMQLRDREFALQFGLGQLRAALPPDKQAEIGHLQRTYDTYLKNILAQGVDEGVFDIADMSITTLAIHTMCEYVFAWFKPGRRLSVDDVAERYADLALRIATSTSRGRS